MVYCRHLARASSVLLFPIPHSSENANFWSFFYLIYKESKTERRSCPCCSLLWNLCLNSERMVGWWPLRQTDGKLDLMTDTPICSTPFFPSFFRYWRIKAYNWIRPVQLGIPLDVREREPQKIWKSKTYSPENSDWSYTATTEIPELIFSCYGTVNILWTSPGLDDYEKRFLWRNWVGRKGLPKGLNMVSLANGEITFSQKIACRSSCFS